MLRVFKNALRALRTGFAPSEGEERTGFEFVWAILMLTGATVVVTLVLRMLFVEAV